MKSCSAGSRQDKEGGQIIAPVAIIKSQSAPGTSTIPVTGKVSAKDNALGDGYSLFAPPSHQTPSSSIKTYIGGGFWLETQPDGKTGITR